MRQRLRWTEDQRDAADELAFHVRYGPPAFKIGSSGSLLR